MTGLFYVAPNLIQISKFSSTTGQFCKCFRWWPLDGGKRQVFKPEDRNWVVLHQVKVGVKTGKIT